MTNPRIKKLSNREIRDAIDKNSLKEVYAQLKKKIKTEFNYIKHVMLKEFDMHEITQEIQNGETADNQSGTLSKGNLFSFLGFYRGDKPIETVRQALNETTIRFGNPKKTPTISIPFIIDYPTVEYIYSITPLPWAPGRSWVWSIERGVSGLGQYLYLGDKHIKGSRSGTAIQNKNQNLRGGFKNSSYLTLMIRRFEKNIQALNKKYLK